MQARNGVSDSQASVNVTDISAQDRFELELLWCIEQLEVGLQRKQPTPKQGIVAVDLSFILWQMFLLSLGIPLLSQDRWNRVCQQKV